MNHEIHELERVKATFVWIEPLTAERPGSSEVGS